jgi:hypothetical protein
MDSLIGCNLSTFSLKYLGIPLSDSKLKISDWQGIIDKVHKKIPNWKGSLLSIGGRIVLLDSAGAEPETIDRGCSVQINRIFGSKKFHFFTIRPLFFSEPRGCPGSG